MKTVDEIATDVFRYVKASALASAVNGKVINGKDRDVSSTTEDIVVKVLANNLAQMQEAYLNVNIYVPDKYNKRQYVKDEERVPLLERLAIDNLSVFHVDDARVTAESQTTLASQNGKEHIINLRLLYRITQE